MVPKRQKYYTYVELPPEYERKIICVEARSEEDAEKAFYWYVKE